VNGERKPCHLVGQFAWAGRTGPKEEDG
jgi:hypothetical protein